MPASTLRPSDVPQRSQSAMGSSVIAAKILRGRVLSVNTKDYTLDVRDELQPFALHYDIPFMVPYAHQSQGEGINFMPEVGAIAWVCYPSEQGRDAFVLGFTMVDEDSSYRGGRELLNPGDLYFSTRDGNFVAVRRGGVVQIGATPICQRVFLPIRNIIQDFAENYELHTIPGDLTWTVARTDEQADGHQKCLLTLAAKEFADDPNKDPVAILKIGSHGDSNDTILTLQTRDKGGGEVKTTLELTKAGEIKWSLQKLTATIETDASLTVKGDLSVVVKGNAKVQSDQTATLQGTTGILKGKNGSVQCDTSGTSVQGPQVKLDAGLFAVLRNSPDFIAWVTAVSAALNVPGPVSGLGGALLPPTQHFNPKVKT